MLKERENKTGNSKENNSKESKKAGIQDKDKVKVKNKVYEKDLYVPVRNYLRQQGWKLVFTSIILIINHPYHI